MKQRETDIVLKKLKNTSYNFYWNHNGTKYKCVMLKTEMYSVLSGWLLVIEREFLSFYINF